jgi:hypothetical protein
MLPLSQCDIHHAFFTRAQSPRDKYNQLNLCPVDRRLHRQHCGADELFWAWQPIIRQKAAGLGVETLPARFAGTPPEEGN